MPHLFSKYNWISFFPYLLDLLKLEPEEDLKQHSKRDACGFYLLKLDCATSLN